MSKIMSPSEVTPITSGQAAKFLDIQMAALRKSGLPSKPTQQVLESQGAALADEFVAAVRKRVEVVSSMIVHHVKVNRARTPEKMLDAMGRKQYTDRKAVDAMPKGGRDEDDVFFFKLGRNISNDDLEREYELRGLKPADPYTQAAVNEADPTFADDRPNGTHWKDAKGNWCYAAFARWDGVERGVYVNSDGDGWYGDWLFAGVRK